MMRWSKRLPSLIILPCRSRIADIWDVEQVKNISWRIKDRLVHVKFPLVMGILNVTPDSFHRPSRVGTEAALRTAEQMLNDGATILDVGGASSRPGANTVSADEELGRVLPVIAAIHDRFPDAPISIDTFHAEVAKEAVAHGASMVNDIGAGLLDENMFGTVASLGVPYVAMHMQGTPQNMQLEPQYTDVVKEIVLFLSQRINAAHEAGIADVIVDPGFGFGKNTAHNFALLKGLEQIAALGQLVLVGVSRKRMINEILGTSSAEALNGTSVLNTIAIMKGAAILRVHDVKEAVQVIKLVAATR